MTPPEKRQERRANDGVILSQIKAIFGKINEITDRVASLEINLAVLVKGESVTDERITRHKNEFTQKYNELHDTIYGKNGKGGVVEFMHDARTFMKDLKEGKATTLAWVLGVVQAVATGVILTLVTTMFLKSGAHL